MDIFTPIQLGPHRLANRIVMAPLTRNRAGEGGVPGDMNKLYYTQRASAGLIITEGVQISEQAVGYPATPGIYNEQQKTAWRKITDAVHEKGGHIFLQLWHCGRVSHSSMQADGGLPVAPSAIRPQGDAMTYEGPKPFETPRALEIAEIPGIIEQYRHAAQLSLEAGFDGVEIHSANGYLLDQFLRDGSNQREDAYGGSLENRTRLLMQVVEAVVGIWGADRVGLRLSPLQPFNDIRDSDPEALFSYVVERLNAYGLAYLHITEMGREAPGVAGPAFDLHKLREIWKGVYMTNFGYDKARANAAIANNEADMIAFGVLFIANPDLPERFATDAPLNPVDESTFYGGDEHGYTDYPFLSEQTSE
jgi:N-ethylmaleimide reductase